MTAQEQQTPIENQIQGIFESMVSIKEKIDANKVMLKEYKIKSDKLDDLKAKKKELNDLLKEEKERIESELYEDKDYERARNDELTFKNQFREQKAMLGVALKQKNNIPRFQEESLITKDGQFRLGLEFSEVVYFNGKKI